MTPQAPSRKGWKPVIGWAFYDWANSAFATTVMAGLFPVFYGSYYRPGAETSTTELALANSAASILVAILAPILGAIADRSGGKRRFLLAFAGLGVLATCGLALIAEGAWLLALVVFGIGLIGFSGANIFYDALLVDVSPEDKRDFVSGFGYSLGYLGGGLLFVLNVLMVTQPDIFGIPDRATAVKLSFVSVGIWWAAFSVPLFFTVSEPRTQHRLAPAEAARAGFRQVIATFQEIRKLRNVAIFLLAYWLYIDGVNTIMRMATKVGQDLGLESDALIKALLVTQFVGFPAAIAFGKLGERIGSKRGIFIGISVYGVTTVLASQMSTDWHFYALAVVVGLVQGGVQSLSRSFFSRIIPPDKSGEFFGFYNMLGKFASILGPLLMAITGLVAGLAVFEGTFVGNQSDRLPIVSLVILFVGGGYLLAKVEDAPSPDVKTVPAATG